jgi:hypothetical protein
MIARLNKVHNTCAWIIENNHVFVASIVETDIDAFTSV